MDPSTARLVANSAGIQAVAKKYIAVQRDPTSRIFMTVLAKPFLFSLTSVDFLRRREVRDRYANMLLLDERKWLDGAQQPVLEYGFQFPRHNLIIAAGFVGGAIIHVG